MLFVEFNTGEHPAFGQVYTLYGTSDVVDADSVGKVEADIELGVDRHLGGYLQQRSGRTEVDDKFLLAVSSCSFEGDTHLESGAGAKGSRFNLIRILEYRHVEGRSQKSHDLGFEEIYSTVLKEIDRDRIGSVIFHRYPVYLGSGEDNVLSFHVTEDDADQWLHLLGADSRVDVHGFTEFEGDVLKRIIVPGSVAAATDFQLIFCFAHIFLLTAHRMEMMECINLLKIWQTGFGNSSDIFTFAFLGPIRVAAWAIFLNDSEAGR